MKPDLPYRNRSEAGRILAEALSNYKTNPDVMVLGLTRGGVPVAAEVAGALGAPLDVVVVRKLGVPSQPELAMGAVSGGGVKVVDQEVVRSVGLRDKEVETVAARERVEVVRREILYRRDLPPLDLNEKIAILVDDGLATGSTMRAAVGFVRQRQAKKVVLAVPVASAQALGKLQPEVDECVCLATPDPFFSVGDWYWNFLPVSDDEVVKYLERSTKRVHAA